MSRIQVETTRFGTLEVDEDKTLTFVGPILGFEKMNRYFLVDHAENSPFKWLQSADNPDLAFVISNPKLFGIEYEFVLPDDAATKLGIQQAEDAMVFTIVNIPTENPSLMTSNLMAPLVMNQNTRQAMQVILQDSKYNTRTRLLPDPTPSSQVDSTLQKS